MSAQRPLFDARRAKPRTPRHRPSPLVAYQRTRDEQRAVAELVLRGGESVHGAGLVRWAKLVLESETEVTTDGEK